MDTRKRSKEKAMEDNIRRVNEDTTARDRRMRIELPDVANWDAKCGKQGKARKDEPPKEEKVERQRRPLALESIEEVYNPPLQFAQMMKHVDDKSSEEHQRFTWDALRKSITGIVDKVNGSNLKNILPELLSENLILGGGIFAHSCMKSQQASQTCTHIFAALVAVVNSQFPEVGELLLKRIVLQLLSAYKDNDKPVFLANVKFIAHLVNQRVAHERIALDLLGVLLEMPSDDDVEVAVDFVKECGAALQTLSPQGLRDIFERFQDVMDDEEIDEQVEFAIEGLFALRDAKFQAYQAVLPGLDLVEELDQITHVLNLDDELDEEASLDVFKVDPDFLENEKTYDPMTKESLDKNVIRTHGVGDGGK